MTIEGNLSSQLSPIYWLQRLLRMEMKDNSVFLKNVSTYLRNKRLNGNNKLLPGKRSQISSRITTVAEYCGYPKGFFSLHSTRSGFLTCAVLKKARKGERIHWEEIAIAQGWNSSDSRNMMIYVKNALRRVMVINRLVAFDVELKENEYSLVAEELMSPEKFHALENPLIPNWPYEVRKHYWLSLLTNKFKERMAKANKPHLLPSSFLSHRQALLSPFYSWMKKHSRYSQRIEEKLPESPSFKQMHNIITKVLTNIAEKSSSETPLVNFLERSSHKIDQIVNNIEVRGGWKRSTTYQNTTSKKPRELDTNNRKRRIMWSDEETTILCKRYLLYPNSWIQIQDHPVLQYRTNTNCKDRMRTLSKQFFSYSNTKAAKDWLNPVDFIE
jgi:hypothetical protein